MVIYGILIGGILPIMVVYGILFGDMHPPGIDPRPTVHQASAFPVDYLLPDGNDYSRQCD